MNLSKNLRKSLRRNVTMVAVIGFLMIIAIVVLLLKGKMSPDRGTGSSSGYCGSDSPVFPGRDSWASLRMVLRRPPAMVSYLSFPLFILVFWQIPDSFDVIVGWLVKSGNNVIAVTVVTAVIATIAHLDGTTAVTVLITIPSMYPVYKR